MKFKTVALSFISICLLGCFASCAEKEEKTNEIPVSRNSVILNSPVVSQKAYDRGIAVGEKISKMERASRERESAVIEAHQMVAALERNGFKQSAQDFAKGVHAGMSKTEIKNDTEKDNNEARAVATSKYDN